MSALSFGPSALDIGKAGTNVFLRENVRNTRHIAAIARRSVPASLETIADDLDQDLVRMVPRMPAGVVRWRRQAAVRAAHAPRRLPFQIRTVTARAVLCIDAPPLCRLASVIGVDQGCTGTALPSGPRDRAKEKADLPELRLRRPANRMIQRRYRRFLDVRQAGNGKRLLDNTAYSLL
jgi:hypothetical protein